MKRTLPLILGLVVAGCATRDGFTMADANRDRVLSFPEFDSYMKGAVFQAVDVDGSGAVSPNEWRAVNPRDPLSEFNGADTDRDGTIARAEADASFDRKGTFRKMFDLSDADHDGTLDKAEAQALAAEFRARAASRQTATSS